MIQLEVLEVRDHGPIAVGYAVDERGTETAVALDVRLAHHLAAALRSGERPTVDVEAWQLLPGFPFLRRVEHPVAP
jgi:hypothetical protein